MKKTTCMALALLALTAAPAQARKMSMMEWMDPTSMTIWKELTPEEKTQSVTDFMSQSGTSPDATTLAKIEACLNKEVADPDYQGTQVPMHIPASYCMMKYQAIAEMKKQ